MAAYEALLPAYSPGAESGRSCSRAGDVSSYASRVADTNYTDGHATGYAAGFTGGELQGFSRPREECSMFIKPGETDAQKKTVSFRLYDTSGLPASGLVGEGALFTPVAGQVQINRDLAGYVNAAGVFSHVGDGEYRYVFDDAEVSALFGEGNIWLRVKALGYRTEIRRVPIQDVHGAAATAVRDAVLNALLSDHSVVGSVADGVAIAAGLLQGNFMMDNVDNTNTNGQTAARMRVWRSAAAMAGATSGGVGLQGAFASFAVTTEYTGPGKIAMHKAVRTA